LCAAFEQPRRSQSKAGRSKSLLFLKKKKQKDFDPAGVWTGIAYNRFQRRRL
jgi:hypothetical protein